MQPLSLSPDEDGGGSFLREGADVRRLMSAEREVPVKTEGARMDVDT